MRIVFLSNYYPPFSRGGYEQWCQEVADALVRRGHSVIVITSRLPDSVCSEMITATEGCNIEVQRCLTLEVEGGLLRTAMRLVYQRARDERGNLSRVRQVLADFAPDVAMVWGMWNVPRSVPALIEQLLPGRVAYYLCDYWPTLPSAYIQQWQNPAARLVARLPKKLIGNVFLSRLRREPPIPLKLEHPLCVSRALRDLLGHGGARVAHARIIQGGIQVDDFRPLALRRWECHDGGLKLLYAGRLTPEKGVHTAIEALVTLAHRMDRSVTLDLVGWGDQHYVKDLRRSMRRARLEDRVTFSGSVERSAMPGLLARYDALLFPSVWAEPFARTVIEAMATGLVVIGTTTGGTADVLVEGETGLTFPAGDSNALATQIQRLGDDRELGRKLAKAARECVEDRFTFTRMVDEIEADLATLAVARCC